MKKTVFDPSDFTRVLSDWFLANQRDLPWRDAENARDAYRVLVSEVMLQQTTVAAVVPFYKKFLARFPNANTLAAASIEEVLPLWEGLGYYRRARLLHACAQAIVEKHGGVFPREYSEVLALPGVGKYTAGAVSSIAHELPQPIVDANVMRVFARLFLIESDVKSSAAQTQFWERATQIVEAAHAQNISPAVINPALMELGALICTPKKPKCERCAVQSFCGAFACNRQDELPQIAPRRAPTPMHDVCIFARDLSTQDEKVLLRQRSHDADIWWRGMWELPRTTRRENEDNETALRRLLRDELHLKETQIGVMVKRIKHGVTIYAIELQCYEVEIEASAAPIENARWFSWPEIEALALPTSMRTLVNWLHKHRSAQAAQPALF